MLIPMTRQEKAHREISPPRADRSQKPQPLLPVNRAFVVQFHADADLAQGIVVGRVEHIRSGAATGFEDFEALRAFLMQLLIQQPSPIPTERG